MPLQSTQMQPLPKVRTVTVFINLVDTTFESSGALVSLVSRVSNLLKAIRKELQDNGGYEVQTIRVATNSFPQWITRDNMTARLKALDECLGLPQHDIKFCALGAADAIGLDMVPDIVKFSSRFSCSAYLHANDVSMAKACAACIGNVAKLKGAEHVSGGLGNFRFAVVNGESSIPFFPAARAPALGQTKIHFAIGTENGELLHHLLENCSSLANAQAVVRDGFQTAFMPIQQACENAAKRLNIVFVGIDTSINPSLNGHQGSVAHAMEQLPEVTTFGSPGTLAAAAALTRAIQSLPGVTTTGYCGLMLPLCEDHRLAELANAGRLSISDLLQISSVCGVGIDTVPVASDCTSEELAGILLDMAALAQRWGKSLSCRLFPVPGKGVGEMTTFDSPYMVNTRVLPLTRHS